jgi:type I restriction enzyme S subunit
MNIAALAECCVFIKDGTHNTPEKVNKGVPVLSAGNVYGGHLSFETNRFATEEDLAVFRKRLHPQIGDVLLTIVGTIGRAAVLTEDKPLIFQRSVCVLRPRPDLLDPLYFRYALESEFVQKQFEMEQQGVAQVGIYLETLNEIQLPLPPLTEQKRIASLLRRADRLRQLRRTAHDLGNALLQSVFLEIFGDPGINPKKWDILPIEDLLSKTRNGLQTGPFGSSLKRHEYVSEGIPVWGINNLGENRFIEDEPLYITADKFRQMKNYTVENGDIFVSRAGTVGRMCVAYPSVNPSIIGTNLVRISLDFSIMHPEYFTAMFSYFGSRFASLKMTDDDNAYSFINPSILRSMTIPVPPLSLQEEFAGVVRRVEGLRGRMSEAERQVEGLFESVLSETFQ